MIFHENRLRADDSHVITYLIQADDSHAIAYFFCRKLGKMSQICGLLQAWLRFKG